MRAWLTAAIVVLGVMSSSGVDGQVAQKAPTDDELKLHLDNLRKKLEDTQTNVAYREQFALEMAATLDRASNTAASGEVRRSRLMEASAVLDDFNAKNPEQPRAGQFQVQSAVYLWAVARSWMQVLRNSPTNSDARAKAVQGLDTVIAKLKPVYHATRTKNDVFGQNVEFRLAQAIADRAEIMPAGPEQDAGNREALAILNQPMPEPSLIAFGQMLRGTLLARLGRFDEAQAALDYVAKVNPAPSEAEQLDLRLTILLGKKQFDAALKAIDAARIDPVAKPALRTQARLEERAAKPEGPERDAIEAAMFRELKSLKESRRPEARSALAAAATALREPGLKQDPEACDLLAEGAVALGDSARAGNLERLAGVRAEALGKNAQAAEYRLRAGAYLFQGEKYRDADAVLTRVAEDEKAGLPRARAGMLRTLARGRALALGQPGVSQADYASALQYQIKTFPTDPATGEARWLLGRLLNAETDRNGALKLWEAIPHGSARWLDASLGIAAIRLNDLETQRLNNDRESVNRLLGEARANLRRCSSQARGEFETIELLLASARLELMPGVGNPAEVHRISETIQRSAATPAQRDTMRRYDLVALALMNRWAEAEQGVRKENEIATPEDLLEIVRRLDRAAAESNSDIKSRRIGYLLRILVGRILEHGESLSPSLRIEARLRMIRALLFSGDGQSARRALAGWTSQTPSKDLDVLRDLGETYNLLEAYEMAIDVERLRIHRLPTGSLPWFDARYSLALAYYRSGKSKEALQLIDGTAILHPDLGGGDIREKFVRLRQRIDANP